MRGDEGAGSDVILLLSAVHEVCGQAVYAANGRKLGVIESAAADRQSGAVQFVVVACRSLLGLRRPRYLVARQALSPRTDGRGFAMTRAGDTAPVLPDADATPAPFVEPDCVPTHGVPADGAACARADAQPGDAPLADALTVQTALPPADPAVASGAPVQPPLRLDPARSH